MLRLENVSKTFNLKQSKVDAVKEVNLTVEDKEILGLVGFSGAGKSTLVRCINLLERPTSGSVWIDDVDITKLNEKDLREVRKKIGMIFQHFNLMRSRTVFDNIAFPLKSSKLSKSEIEKKVNNLLQLVELEDKKDAYPSQLSGGQKQRVAIARALANDPKILLCDEATSALDPQTTHSILKLLKQVNQTMGITIIIITHEMAVVKEICNKVGIMEDGYIKEYGNVIDIFSNPKEPITRSFIDATSNIDKVYELIEDNTSIVKLKDNEKMVMLSYDSNNTAEALISKISRDYEVNANIIFGNIEIIQNQPLGRLVVIMSGKSENIDHALKLLEKERVRVEVISYE